MSGLIQSGIYTAVALAFLGLVIALFPGSNQFPYPSGVATVLFTIVSFMWALDPVLPVHELLSVTKYGLSIMVTTSLIVPAAIMCFKFIRE